MKLTKATARKVLSIVDQGLTHGLGWQEPGKMCVEAAICAALDMPHGDDPGCVAQLIRRYKIRLNDSLWSSNKARAKGMRRAAIAQLGSAFLDEPANAVLRQKARDYIIEQTIRRIVPEGLRAAARVHKNRIHAEAMIEAATRCELEGTRDSALNANKVGRDAASSAAYSAAYAAYAAASSASAAASAAYAAAYAAASDAASSAAYTAAERDRILTIGAEICVEACILVKTPGSKWLDITEE